MSTRPHALVPAAGVGRRFGGSTPKQFGTVHGRTVVEWAVERLRLAGVESIVVAVPEASVAAWSERIGGGGVHVVAGGATRQASVHRCLTASPAATDDLVVVHDAARAAVDSEDVRAVIAAAAVTGGAILGRPVADTLKRVADGRVLATVDRADLFRAETPQVFRRSVLEAALAEASSRGFTGTDEASVVEAAGGAVAVVVANRPNPKITWPGDLALLESLVVREALGSGR